jgi:hypothetical protein
LAGWLPVSGEILRGSLLERTIRNHARGYAKCASGERHALSVLTGELSGRADAAVQPTRQHGSRGALLAGELSGAQAQAIEAICELNHELLRPDEAAARTTLDPQACPKLEL